MEAIKSLQSYWRRRTYQKLESSPAPEKKEALVKLDGGRKRRRRRLLKAAVVVLPAMRQRKLTVPKTPAKVMSGLRDAYMNVMLMLAGDGGAAAKKDGGGGGGAVWDRRIPRARQGSLRGGDFENRVMVHLYNSVIATR